MDDFMIPAKTMEELEEQMIRFLKIAEKHNLYFKRSKCDFNRNPHTRDNSWKRTSQDRTGKDKGGEGVENTNKSQGCQEFS